MDVVERRKEAGKSWSAKEERQKISIGRKSKVWVGGDGIYFGVGGRNFVEIIDHTFRETRGKVS